MFRVKPSIKQLQKYKKQTSNLLEIPTEWEEFTKLTTIRSGGEMKKFNTYPYQKLLIDLSKEYSNIIVLKSRQLGITQAIAGLFLHDACVNPAASSIMFLRNAEDASAVSRRVRQMLLSIPEYAVAENDNVGYLKIKGKGDIYFKNSGREGSRSLDSATGMLFDESAFVENIQEIYSASNPSAALTGDRIKKFIVSTPSAKSGWYWDKLNQDNGTINIEQLAIDVASNGLYKDIPGCYWFVDSANCCKLILHWTAHPVYSKIPEYLEYRMKQDGTDWETVLREYDLRFVDSAVAVFSSDLIAKNAYGAYESEADSDAVYYMGIDTATTGNDYCGCIVLKEVNNHYSVVALYRKRHETSEYHMYQIGELINKYRPSEVGIEITGGVGQVYMEKLNSIYTHISFNGIRTTGDSKPLMVSLLQYALETKSLDYPKKSPIPDEMLSFKRNGKKLEAAPGKHDDTVMMLCFALKVSPFSFRLINHVNIDLIKEAR